MVEISVKASANESWPTTTRGRRAFHSTRNASCSHPNVSPSRDARIGSTPDSVMSVSKRSNSTALIIEKICLLNDLHFRILRERRDVRADQALVTIRPNRRDSKDEIID